MLCYLLVLGVGVKGTTGMQMSELQCKHTLQITHEQQGQAQMSDKNCFLSCVLLIKFDEVVTQH